MAENVPLPLATPRFNLHYFSVLTQPRALPTMMSTACWGLTRSISSRATRSITVRCVLVREAIRMQMSPNDEGGEQQLFLLFLNPHLTASSEQMDDDSKRQQDEPTRDSH